MNGDDHHELGANKAARPRARRQLLRPAIDAFAAFLIFAGVMAGVAAHPSAASPHIFAVTLDTKASDDSAPVVQIATTASQTSADAVYRRTSEHAAYGLLGVAFSLLAALNLAVFRHLRQAYARPARRVRARR